MFLFFKSVSLALFFSSWTIFYAQLSFPLMTTTSIQDFKAKGKALGIRVLIWFYSWNDHSNGVRSTGCDNPVVYGLTVCTKLVSLLGPLPILFHFFSLFAFTWVPIFPPIFMSTRLLVCTLFPCLNGPQCIPKHSWYCDYGQYNLDGILPNMDMNHTNAYTKS